MQKTMFFTLFILCSQAISGQQLDAIEFQTTGGLSVRSFVDGHKITRPPQTHPLFSLLVDGQLRTSLDAEDMQEAPEALRFRLGPLQVTLRQTKAYRPGCRYELQLQNTTPGDTRNLR